MSINNNKEMEPPGSSRSSSALDLLLSLASFNLSRKVPRYMCSASTSAPRRRVVRELGYWRADDEEEEEDRHKRLVMKVPMREKGPRWGKYERDRKPIYRGRSWKQE